jgi:hypothetical protein
MKPEFITGDWQVRVEVYKDYVLKIPKTVSEIMQQIKQSDWTKKFTDKKIKIMANDSLAKHHKSVDIIKRSGVPLSLFADPEWLDKDMIKQKRVLIINDALKNKNYSNIEILKECIDSYVDLWTYGLFDTSWNFTLNNGINKDGNIVFVDVGECSDNIKELQLMLQEQSWKTAYSMRQDIGESLQKSLLAYAKKILTLENLKQVWKSKTNA